MWCMIDLIVMLLINWHDFCGGANTGGGAIEIELSKYLRDYSRTVAGKEQLIIAAVAKALEVIPRQLCDNAGFDSTNVLNRLREKHAKGLLVGDCSLVSLTVRPFYSPLCDCLQEGGGLV